MAAVKIAALIRDARDVDSEKGKEAVLSQFTPLINSFVIKALRLGYKETWEDMFQQGALALFTAVKDFDSTKYTKFMTLASSYIKNALSEMGKDKEEDEDIFPDEAGDENSRLAHEALSDDNPLENLITKERMTEAINAWRLVDSLPENRRRVILLRFKDDKSLAEVGKELGVCRERARQLETSALRKLRTLLEENSKNMRKAA